MVVLAVGAFALLAPSAGAAISPEEALQVVRGVERSHIPLPRLSPETLGNLGHVATARYGTEDAALVRVLDDAKDSATTAVDDTATRVTEAGDTEAQGQIRDCAKQGFSDVADSFQTALQDQTDLPNLHDGFVTAVVGCLSTQFPDTPDEVRSYVADALTGQFDDSANQALAANPPAPVFGDWLQATADDVSASTTETTTDTQADTTADFSSSPTTDSGGGNDSGGGGSPVVWIVLGLVAAGGVVAVVVWRRRRAQ